jgi:hypothetical protein
MRALIIIAVLAVVLALGGGTAAAYPQFQLSRDSTCSGCHISPAGGGLLSENGANTAEEISALGTNPEFMYGKVPTPEWLQLGGDIRVQGGYLQAPQRYLWAFPMQGDIYAAATKNSFSLHVTAGLRTSQEGNEAATYIWAREHYVQWQQEPGAREGLFVRAGHFMPVFGLRWVEHPFYVRRYGGTPLFSETYALSASMVKSRFEAHVTGFVKNPLLDPVRQENGAAAYAELRLSDTTLVGAGGMFDARDSDWYTLRGVLTAKQYLAGPELLLQGELQVINPHVTGYGYNQLASNLMVTYMGPKGLMIDVAWGHYDSNIRVSDLDKDAFDLNLHWFMTSHIELVLVNRAQFIALGDGGPTGAWSMLQLHYRL